MLIDTHTHIADPEFDEDRDAVIERALAVGVKKMVIIGTDLASSKRALALAEKHPFLWATVGLHPHDAKDMDEPLLKKLDTLAEHPKVVGWGEVGLDFFYQHSTREAQEKAFVMQIRAAKRRGLPLVIHTRDAWPETFDIFKAENIQEHAAQHGVVLHCFTGDAEIAKRGLQFGCYLSFSGIMTFPKAKAVQEAATAATLERIVIETDAPYLAPQGFRGKRNEPAYVRKIAEDLARLKNIPFEALAKATSENAERLFNLKITQAA